MSEDVYDLPRAWCHVCQAQHEDCDPYNVDLRYTCLACFLPIEFEDEDPDEPDFHPQCNPSVPMT